MRGNNAVSVLGITPPHPQGIPFLYLVSVIKNIMMNAYFFQMNNLKQLAADKMNN